MSDKNIYLAEHGKASLEKALSAIERKIKELKLSNWLSVFKSESSARALCLEVNEEKLEEQSRLDGCYVLKTDLGATELIKEEVHARYKDLAHVERAFREMKMEHLELRPLHVRSKASTRAHVFVVMMAYMITKELGNLWKEMNLTVQEGLRSLSTLTLNYVKFPTGLVMSNVPQASEINAQLLKAAGVEIPTYLFRNKVDIHTHKQTRKTL